MLLEQQAAVGQLQALIDHIDEEYNFEALMNIVVQFTTAISYVSHGKSNNAQETWLRGADKTLDDLTDIIPKAQVLTDTLSTAKTAIEQHFSAEYLNQLGCRLQVIFDGVMEELEKISAAVEVLQERLDAMKEARSNNENATEKLRHRG